MKVIIIGGGASGASCGARLRRLDEKAEITILEKTDEISIANCGLPYYVSDVINDRDKMLVSTPQKFKSWFNIDIRLNSEAVKIDRVNKKVILSTGEELEYDKLVLTPGASPIIPPFEAYSEFSPLAFKIIMLCLSYPQAEAISSFICSALSGQQTWLIMHILPARSQPCVSFAIRFAIFARARFWLRSLPATEILP